MNKLSNLKVHIPKYERVKLGILEYIKQLPENEGYLPTLEQLEKHFGVARITIRRAVAELRNEGILKSTRGKGTIIIKQLPMEDAAPEFSMENKTIGVIFHRNIHDFRPGLLNPQINHFLEKKIHQYNGKMVCYNTAEPMWQKTDNLLRALKEKGISWVFLSGLGVNTKIDTPTLGAIFVENSIRTVIIADDLSMVAPGMDCVYLNCEQALINCVRENFSGSRFAGFITSAQDISWAQKRSICINNITQRLSIPYEEIIIDAEREAAGYEGARQLMARAKGIELDILIIGANDAVASGILKYLESMKKNIPEEISVIGFDNAEVSIDSNISTFDKDPEGIVEALFFLYKDFAAGTIKSDMSAAHIVYPFFIERGSSKKMRSEK